MAFGLSYEFTQKGDILHFRVTGFTTLNRLTPVMQEIINQIEEAEKRHLPYKLLFDLRGLKALDPRTADTIKELDVVIFKSSAIKVGTVLDSIIAKIQQMRVANEYRMPNAQLFGNYEECLAWLKE